MHHLSAQARGGDRSIGEAELLGHLVLAPVNSKTCSNIPFTGGKTDQWVLAVLLTR